jgi:nucleoid DNA-binding protein
MAEEKKKAMTKSALLGALAESSGLNKKQVASVLDGLGALARNELGKKGPGVVTIPGMMKLTSRKKPATKARMGVNPFTKQPQMIAAKPASVQVRARVLKVMRDEIKL